MTYYENTLDEFKEEVELNTKYLENNHLILVGKVASEKRYSHEIYGEKFYLFNLEVV